MSKMKLLLDVVQDLRALATSMETLAGAIADTEAAPEPLPSTVSPAEAPTSAPKLTIVELRAFVAERSAPENRASIKAILSAHGVNKLTELPEDKYETVMQEVAAL